MKGAYLYLPLTEDERAALKARKLKLRQGGRADRPAYALRDACAAHWPEHVPTLVFIPWVRP
jgi:hypothetical protein